MSEGEKVNDGWREREWREERKGEKVSAQFVSQQSEILILKCCIQTSKAAINLHLSIQLILRLAILTLFSHLSELS